MKHGWKKWAVSAALVTGAMALAACGGSSSSSSSDTGSGGSGSASTLILSSDLPLQGASADASKDTENAIKLILKQAGGKAGAYTIEFKSYDNSTAAAGAWDPAQCSKNAQDHVATKNEVAVMGTYNSGCAKQEVPVLNQADNGGGLLMISHANTNPGLTKAWDPGEPDKYYPTGKRNYGRVVATDDFQGAAGAQFAQSLGLKTCYVLNDTQTYGVGVAKAFVDEAKKQGITVIGDGPAGDGWDAKQPSYKNLFEKAKASKPDCVYLGGINDNNGITLIKDKVAVLGPNSGAVKLIMPDGFTGYPEVQKLPEAQDSYLTFAGLPIDVLATAGGEAQKFQDDFKAEYGHAPASNYAVYGAAATQLILKAIAASDGTRADVIAKAFSGITVPAAESVIGKEFGIDQTSGDTTVRDMSIELMKGNAETFLKPWPVS
jgi:branched-chain amino acid transport system substrate-binding protein